jgi:hypothetical protein
LPGPGRSISAGPWRRSTRRRTRWPAADIPSGRSCCWSRAASSTPRGPRRAGTRVGPTATSRTARPWT